MKKLVTVLLVSLSALVASSSYASNLSCDEATVLENISSVVNGVAVTQMPFDGEDYIVKARQIENETPEVRVYEAVRILTVAPYPNCVYSSEFRIKIREGSGAFGRKYCVFKSIEASSGFPAMPDWVAPFCLKIGAQ